MAALLHQLPARFPVFVKESTQSHRILRQLHVKLLLADPRYLPPARLLDEQIVHQVKQAVEAALRAQVLLPAIYICTRENLYPLSEAPFSSLYLTREFRGEVIRKMARIIVIRSGITNVPPSASGSGSSTDSSESSFSESDSGTESSSHTEGKVAWSSQSSSSTDSDGSQSFPRSECNSIFWGWGIAPLNRGGLANVGVERRAPGREDLPLMCVSRDVPSLREKRDHGKQIAPPKSPDVQQTPQNKSQGVLLLQLLEDARVQDESAARTSAPAPKSTPSKNQEMNAPSTVCSAQVAPRKPAKSLLREASKKSQAPLSMTLVGGKATCPLCGYQSDNCLSVSGHISYFHNEELNMGLITASFRNIHNKACPEPNKAATAWPAFSSARVELSANSFRGGLQVGGVFGVGRSPQLGSLISYGRAASFAEVLRLSSGEFICRACAYHSRSEEAVREHISTAHGKNSGPSEISGPNGGSGNVLSLGPEVGRHIGSPPAAWPQQRWAELQSFPTPAAGTDQHSPLASREGWMPVPVRHPGARPEGAPSPDAYPRPPENLRRSVGDVKASQQAVRRETGI